MAKLNRTEVLLVILIVINVINVVLKITGV